MLKQTQIQQKKQNKTTKALGRVYFADTTEQTQHVIQPKPLVHLGSKT